MSKDLFIYRIIEDCWTKRRFRKRHEDFFEKNIQLILHEFMQLNEKILYKEETFVNRENSFKYNYKDRKDRYETLCIFCDTAWNVICQKILKENDFKRDR